MPLQRGEILGYDFNRMIVDFTMLNQGKTVRCAISTAAMDDLPAYRLRLSPFWARECFCLLAFVQQVGGANKIPDRNSKNRSAVTM